MCGGWSEPKPTDGDISMISKWMQNISEGDTKIQFNEFKAIEYRSQVVKQVVKGLNYLIKVQVGENDYVHLQVFRTPLQETEIEVTFKGAQSGYKRDDPLEPFKPFD